MRCLAFFFTLVLTSIGTAHADPELFTGRILVGVDPIGARLGIFASSYDLVDVTQTFDVAGRIGHTRSTTVWLGGELGLAASYTSTRVEPGMFLLFSFERLFRVPLVPMFRFGASETTAFHNSQTYSSPGVGGLLELGAAVYYFVTPHVGIGFDARVAGGGLHACTGCGGGEVFTELEAGLRFAL